MGIGFCAHLRLVQTPLPSALEDNKYLSLSICAMQKVVDSKEFSSY
jgi:hypothetical protein